MKDEKKRGIWRIGKKAEGEGEDWESLFMYK